MSRITCIYCVRRLSLGDYLSRGGPFCSAECKSSAFDHGLVACEKCGRFSYHADGCSAEIQILARSDERN